MKFRKDKYNSLAYSKKYLPCIINSFTSNGKKKSFVKKFSVTISRQLKMKRIPRVGLSVHKFLEGRLAGMKPAMNLLSKRIAGVKRYIPVRFTKNTHSRQAIVRRWFMTTLSKKRFGLPLIDRVSNAILDCLKSVTKSKISACRNAFNRQLVDGRYYTRFLRKRRRRGKRGLRRSASSINTSLSSSFSFVKK
jgi:ribosomal protein S7